MSNARDIRMVVLVNKYATPFALLLVTLGIFLSQPQGLTRHLSISLLVFSIVFNWSAVHFIKRMGETMPWMAKLRLLINVSVNVVLVYSLGGHWGPMWLLLVLTPIATAIYEDRAKTLVSAAGTSVALLLIHAARRHVSPVEWGQQISYAAFILLLSLMINELAHLAKTQDGGR